MMQESQLFFCVVRASCVYFFEAYPEYACQQQQIRHSDPAESLKPFKLCVKFIGARVQIFFKVRSS